MTSDRAEHYAKACAELHAEGKRVTVAAVRDRAGGGSNRDIVLAVRTWVGNHPTEAAAEAVAEAASDATRAAPPSAAVAGEAPPSLILAAGKMLPIERARLHPDDIAAIAQAVADKLQTNAGPAGSIAVADVIAREFGGAR